jgi:glutaredoxin
VDVEVKMKLTKIILLLILVISVALITGCSKGQGKYDAFANCLYEKGAVMYGTEWCSHCQNQKKAFGKESFKYINYIDCDKNSEECLKNGIKGYPTWIINGEKYSGEQPLARLASLTDCKLEEN